MLIERRYTELRQTGRRLSGAAITYGEVAELPFGREKFEAGAFAPLGDVILNVQHDRGRPLARTNGGGLAFDDNETALKIRAELPETSEADNTLNLVKAGVLRGLSIEFSATSERSESDLRIVEKAVLKAVGVVDSGAYPGSNVEARRRGGRRGFARSRIPYRKTLGCECHRGACNQVRFEPGAFDDAMSGDSDVLAISGGDFSRAIGSLKRGTLTLKSSDEGLDISLSAKAGMTPAGKELSEMAAAVPIRARPIFDQDRSEFTEAKGPDGEIVATYRRVHLRALLLKPLADDGGWPETEFFTLPTKGRELPTQQERRRVWL